ncbi:MAG: transketolase [Elusimicrobiaceae bacterium]|nr:transketolase [Elusimicrobiaceae bacterium]
MNAHTLTDRNTLKKTALAIRRNIIRAITANRGGHIGGSLDLADMLAVVYTDFMRINPQNPRWEKRDLMIFSKGHAGPALYAALAEKGFFPKERLDNLNNPNSLLPGHCDRKIPGVDATTGSLGQGLSLACGAALGAKISDSGQNVFCVTGDGESAEGQIWEAAQFAAHFHLDNLIGFLDWNKKQIDGTNDEVLSLGDVAEKYRAFGWNVVLVKGNDVTSIQKAVSYALNNPNGKPSMIILDTVKGEGAECIARLSNNHCIGFPEELQRQVQQELDEKARQLDKEGK